MNKQNRIRVLYLKLLTLYPQGFRERLAEPMEQTFNDIYNEHKQQATRNLSGFVL